MKRFLRRLWRRIRGPVAIPGRYPWLKDPVAPAYGTTLFEDANFRHYADGMGGIVSIVKNPRGPGLAYRAVHFRTHRGKR